VDSPEPPQAVVDLRSDTVTRPTPAMRRAIAAAEVGDDALGDDPTTRRLEERVAALLGKEAALFFPSGIMANQTALAVLGQWGGEVVLDAGAHILHYEEGAAAALSGLQLRAVPSEGGLLSPEDVAAAIRKGSRYFPRTCLVALENTHLDSGGRIFPLERLRAVARVAEEHGLPVHLDGARIWHACVETGASAADQCRAVTTVMVSFSKGLGAPVGSALAGPREVIEKAWRVRRRLGGGMRQSGILAAAALHALDHHVDRLAEDHARARRLAAAFDRTPGFRASPPESNIVIVEASSPRVDLPGLLAFLQKRSILMLKFGESRLRAVTHLDVDDAGIVRVVNALREWSDVRPVLS
jgi:threonine aldolase